MDSVFATWLIISNVWLAASFTITNIGVRLLCTAIGFLWLVMGLVRLATL